MCGRFGSAFSGSQLISEFDLSNKPRFKKSYNVAPSQMILAVTKNSPNRGVMMRWQFVPEWQKPAEAKFKPINARDDKLEGGFYRQSFHEKRCLIPASFFYEWKRVVVDGKEAKRPYLIKIKNEDVFGVAGIYSIHPDAEGTEHYFCAIVTTRPNELMKPIHDRMPVIIHKDDYDTWLAGEVTDARRLLKPFDSDQMEAWRVGSEVNSPRNNNEELTNPVNPTQTI